MLQSAEILQISLARLRAQLLRMRGASLGPKVNISSRLVLKNAPKFSCGERCVFEHDVYIKIAEGAMINMGDNVFVGRGVEFDIQCGLNIGNDVLFAPGVFLADHSHRHSSHEKIASQGCESLQITVGDDVWIGAKSVILSGVHIGNGAIVGAQSLVNRDIAPYSIVGGVPARVIGRRS